MIYPPLVALILFVALLSLVLIVGSDMRARAEARIRRKHEDAFMAELGVSRGYIQAHITNLENLMAGRITEQVWLEHALAIAAKYPQYQREEECEVET